MLYINSTKYDMIDMSRQGSRLQLKITSDYDVNDTIRELTDIQSIIVDDIVMSEYANIYALSYHGGTGVFTIVLERTDSE